MIQQILMAVMAVGAVLGGVDRILGNRFGLGAQFEKGFQLLGPMALSMAGMICLAPVLEDCLGGLVVPLFRAIGVDPAMFGSILAIDMGGYPLAEELASDPRIGRYAGIVVSSMFGCTVVFTIPVAIGVIPEGDRNAFARGIMTGLAAMPIGLLIGGLASGFSLFACLWQNMPILLFSALLFLGLHFAPERVVRGFCILAEGLKILITAGLVLGAVQSLTGLTVLPGMVPLPEALSTVCSIGIVMLGSLPLAELLCRGLQAPLSRLGSRLGLSALGITSLLTGLVTPLPALSLYGQMDGKTKELTAAFLVSGASLFAAHLGFTLGTEPAMVLPLIAGKLSGAAAAAVLVLGLQHRPERSGSSRISPVHTARHA